MSPPRSTAVQALVACCLLAVVAVGPGLAGATVQDPSESVRERGLATPCDPTPSDAYRPPELDDPWRETATDGDRRLNWSGGDPAPIGPIDDCSLAVADGATASPNDTQVSGDDGVVTGVVDLGANGSLAFVGVATATGSNGTTTAAAATDNTTRDGATELVLANPGAATARNVSVRANGTETTLTVPNGRFFAVAVRWTGNGTARVAVWDSDDPWDGEWDATVRLADGADWAVELRGPVYLDGLAVGVAESPAEPTTARPDDGGSEDEDDSEDDFFPDDYETASDPRDDAGGGGGAVLGFIVLVFGAGSAYFARPVARISEQIDAIGSTTPASEVEPAEWNVVLTRIVGILFAVLGVAMMVGSL